MKISESKTGFVLPKKDLNKLLKVLKEYGKIIAPVQDNKWIRMQEISKENEITFKGFSWYSSKKFVFPQKQVLFEFNGNKITKPKNIEENKVLFGLRQCDLNSFMINDKLFLEQNPANENYKKAREKITLVGLWCEEKVDNYCFCSSLDLKHYYDICLFEKEDHFHIKSGSKKGDEILSKLNLKEEQYKAQIPDCSNKLHTTDIEKFFNRDDKWQEGADKCLSCGDCTSLCPTCLCFDVEDELNLDMKSGVRTAKWDSCMFKDFTKVAGGHYFREARINRFKHRFFHKLVYFPKKFEGLKMCTGCGRCIRGCPTKIHWVSEINGLQHEFENGGAK